VHSYVGFYDEFYQVGVPSRSTRDGYGLALSIVTRLVKLLVLKLDVRSEVGRGSSFSLVLPASNEDTAPAVHASKQPASYDSQVGTARILLAGRGATTWAALGGPLKAVLMTGDTSTVV
jgi:hypothetical protein